MRSAIILIMALIPFQSFAGVGGGGVGPRPTNSFAHKTDFVHTLDFSGDKVTFLYKAFDQSGATRKTVEINDVNDAYLKALARSHDSGQWMGVSVEE